MESTSNFNVWFTVEPEFVKYIYQPFFYLLCPSLSFQSYIPLLYMYVIQFAYIFFFLHLPINSLIRKLELRS